MKTLLLVAGDASGDQHAAEFVRAFRALHPDTRFVGLGGDAMQEAGVILAVDQRELAVGGFFELAGSLHRILRTWKGMVAALRTEQPDLVVLIDSGGFNLPFARRVRQSSGAPILYYVAPQVWAWRPGRIRKLARRIDRMALILPFESEIYVERQIPADFVGHPLVDSLEAQRVSQGREQARSAVGLEGDGAWVALAPGSRRNEVKQNLPLQLEAARLLHQRRPEVKFVLCLAGSIDEELVAPICRRARLPDTLRLVRVVGRSREAIRAADVVLAKPGTVTLEAALLERPMVVMGRVHPLTAAILRRWVRAPFFAMPNLIAETALVPELLQEQAQPEAMARQLLALLDGPARDEQLAGLAEVRRRLGGEGASSRVAAIAEEMLALDTP